MDCRGTVLLALGLVCGIAGCGPERTMPVVPPTPEPPPEARQLSKLPKRTPKATTCMAFGEFREREADDPEKSPAEKEQLRDQARKAYQQALSIDANCLPASQALARLYVKMGNYQMAVESYQKILKAHPKEPALWFDLGMCHARNKAWEPALESLRMAVKLDPENSHYANTLGYCLARAGRFGESFAVFQKREGSEAKAHYQLARMLYELRQDEACQQHLQLALQKEPGLTSAELLLVELERGSSGAAVQVKYETVEQPGQK